MAAFATTETGWLDDQMDLTKKRCVCSHPRVRSDHYKILFWCQKTICILMFRLPAGQYLGVPTASWNIERASHRNAEANFGVLGNEDLPVVTRFQIWSNYPWTFQKSSQTLVFSLVSYMVFLLKADHSVDVFYHPGASQIRSRPPADQPEVRTHAAPGCHKAPADVKSNLIGHIQKVTITIYTVIYTKLVYLVAIET